MLYGKGVMQLMLEEDLALLTLVGCSKGNVLTNLDYANRPGADVVNDEYENNRLTKVLHSDTRNSRRSVFSRLSLAPKVHKPREQEFDYIV